MNNTVLVTAPTAHAPMPSPAPKLGVGSIASRWRELHGARSWAGLLDPLDADLRKVLFAYGELVGVTSDGFNSETRSPHAGSCHYIPADLLTASTVSRPEYYTVTKFLYATSGHSAVTEALFVRPLQEDGALESNWMGYVAVATDEGAAALGRRDIVVAWRGTNRDSEKENDFDFILTSAAPVLGPSAAANADAKVHHGFLSVYTSSDKDSKYDKTSARDQVIKEVRRLMEVHKDEVTSITVTGHSLGASLATLNAVDMVANGVNIPDSIHQPPCPVTAILFASPKVGNDGFKSAFASFHHLRALHVKNAGDKVPTLPPSEFGYVDAATATLPIDTDRSPYLGQQNWETYHNLECYLHGVALDHGAAGEFVVHRDVALVNKSANALKDKYPVPANWWVVKNKWMVKGADGCWKLEDFKEA